MKPKTPPARRSEKTTEPPADGQTPINITPEEGKTLRECAAKTGQTLGGFVRKMILEGCAKLDDVNLTAIPCPFCKQTDMLEIILWSNERADGNEYNGNAVRCNRCDAIAPLSTWIKRGLPGDSREASRKGGAA
jgi:hypothetical protein